ncbi:MAG: hypothetical protein HY908_21635 [Myxococcales bacterium]|nr:hypothetical protein [Myxococcales bacterium]
MGVEGVPPGSETFGATQLPEHHADAVVLVGEPVAAAIVVEVQLRADPAKRRSWPVYVTGLWARHGCPVYLLVVCLSEPTARFCERPILLGHPGFELRPVVVGPERVVAVEDPAQAAVRPELAVLSALAHGGHAGRRTATASASQARDAGDSARAARCAVAAAEGLFTLPDQTRYAYLDLLLSALGTAARRALEEWMSQQYEYQSKLFRDLMKKGRKEGLEKGLAEGREQGREQGREEGRRALAAGIVGVLRARGLAVPEGLAGRLDACHELAELERVLERAAVVARAEELLE